MQGQGQSLNLKWIVLLSFFEFLTILSVVQGWSRSSPLRHRMLFVLTNHEHVKTPTGSDGLMQTLPTGWYLPECAHPYFEFEKVCV